MKANISGLSDRFADATYAKVSHRLIPFLFVLYVVAFLDRVNVSYAQLQMSADLRFSNTTYGLGAGLFFVGYFLFEIPSNLILERVGARIWIARILVVWGFVAAAFMFVQTPVQFYVLRFLLGVGEAGFFPGIVLFLTYWFPAAFRARVISQFMTGIAVAGIVGGPLSGWILHATSGVFGIAGWQWLFLIEGAPAVVLGFWSLLYLQDGPQKANWLTEHERGHILRDLNDERQQLEIGGRRHLSASVRDPALWALASIGLCINLGMYGVSFFLPQLLKDMNVNDPLSNGLLSAIPYGIAAAAMVLNGRHSDATMERRWHTAVPASAAAVGLIIAAAAGSGRPVVAMLGLTVATAGTLSSASAFWSIPPAFFAASAAAGGIALINSLANLGGFLGPTLVGVARDYLRHDTGGLYLLAAVFCACASLTLSVRAKF